MRKEEFCEIFGDINENHIKEARLVKGEYRHIKWIKIGTLAACFCLVVTGALLTVNAYASNNNEALLEVDTIPPAGLSLTIDDATPDDAEFLITNDTEFQVDYGKANRIERYDGENWVEVTTESVGIFPSATVTIKNGEQMYGMCGWVSKRIILEAGTYRYLLVVDIYDVDNETYPVVLKAEFEIK